MGIPGRRSEVARGIYSPSTISAGRLVPQPKVTAPNSRLLLTDLSMALVLSGLRMVIGLSMQLSLGAALSLLASPYTTLAFVNSPFINSSRIPNLNMESVFFRTLIDT